MSNVLHFPAPLSLRLDSGWVRDPDTGRLGDHRHFWLEFVARDGSISGLWTGFGYEEALAAARYSRRPGMRFEDRYAAERHGGVHGG
jgi:hypothetical protein